MRLGGPTSATPRHALQYGTWYRPTVTLLSCPSPCSQSPSAVCTFPPHQLAISRICRRELHFTTWKFSPSSKTTDPLPTFAEIAQEPLSRSLEVNQDPHNGTLTNAYGLHVFSMKFQEIFSLVPLRVHVTSQVRLPVGVKNGMESIYLEYLVHDILPNFHRKSPKPAILTSYPAIPHCKSQILLLYFFADHFSSLLHGYTSTQSYYLLLPPLPRPMTLMSLRGPSCLLCMRFTRTYPSWPVWRSTYGQ